MTEVRLANAPARDGRSERPRFERLIVATAGDEVSLGAIHLAVELARRDGASVTAVAVAPPLPTDVTPVLAPTPLMSDERNRLELLQVLHDTLKTVAGTETWDERALVGMPAPLIDSVAGDRRDTLVLMGLGHRGRLDRLFRGETTIPLLKHARVPVLAAASTARGLPVRAVAAVDFSPASISAAICAAALLGDGGTLTLAHVGSFGDAHARPGDLVDLYRAGVRARLDEATQLVQRRTRGAVASVVLHGQIAEALLEFADESRCDVISLGGHEQGLVDRILLGSVRTRVVRAAKCSVLIAPPPSPR
jgi:nucleotide-binding universal stress UspA family protein